MEQSILTPAQQRVLELLGNHAVLAAQFYLSGGTALAEEVKRLYQTGQ